MNGTALERARRGLHRIHGLGVLPLVVTLVVPAAHAVTAFDFDTPRERLPAPGFELPDLRETPTGLEDYHGKVVLLHFWATFCTPCLEELPALEALWRHYREGGLVIVGVATDRGHADAVRKFARETGVTFPVLLDPDGAVRNRYEVVALPMSYVIGRDGRLSARILGSQDWQDPQATEFIESLLREGEP